MIIFNDFISVQFNDLISVQFNDLISVSFNDFISVSFNDFISVPFNDFISVQFNNFIADSINLFHFMGMTIVGVSPVMPFFIELVTKKKKHSRKIYLGLTLISSSVLASYFFYKDVCLISICENYFCSEKYPVYTVSQTTKLNLYASTICLGLQTYLDNFKLRSITVVSYYGYIFYAFLKKN